MRIHFRSILASLLLLATIDGFAAEDKIELETTIIKGNKELPRILYVVPWKDARGEKATEQKLVLHSLFGDLFDPIIPMGSADPMQAADQ